MTGGKERCPSPENENRPNTHRDATATPPQSQQGLAASCPLLHRTPLHCLQSRGLFVLKTPLNLAHHLMPQGVGQPSASWFSQETESHPTAEAAAPYPSRPLLTDMPVGAPSVRTPALFLCYSPVPGLGPTSSSGRERIQPSSDPLFAHGFCKWPGCEQVFKEYELFLKHLDDVHSLGDTSTAQCMIQRERVDQLQRELQFERDRLVAMQSQLRVTSTKESPRYSTIAEWLRVCALPLVTTDPSEGRHWDKDKTSLLTGNNPSLEYYKVCNVRPPLTYAALIRWAILESPSRQLPLNDIYRWFTGHFAYFRYNTATWKNAVRHNLSLHKCFVRLEDVKGAVWAVDEQEYQLRQGRRVSRDPDTRWSPHAAEQR